MTDIPVLGVIAWKRGRWTRVWHFERTLGVAWCRPVPADAEVTRTRCGPAPNCRACLKRMDEYAAKQFASGRQDPPDGRRLSVMGGSPEALGDLQRRGK